MAASSHRLFRMPCNPAFVEPRVLRATS